MTHHLTLNSREQIHRHHQSENGYSSSRQVNVTVPLSSLSGVEHQLVVKTHALPKYRQRIMQVTMVLEICVQCGLTESIVCLHGMSYWTHRPGCFKFDQDVWNELQLPDELYRTYDEAFAWEQDEPNPHCQGCLLVCPICKADGT